MQLERSGSVAVSYTPPVTDPSTPERVPLDLRRFVLQPQQTPPAPLGPLAALDRRDALVGGAMFSGSLALTAASVLCPALSWWALAGLAGGSAGVTAAVQSGLARRARQAPTRDRSMWPLNMQREAILKTLQALHSQRPPNAARAALSDQLRQAATDAGDGYASFLRALGPFGSAVDTQEVLKYMRWHALLDWRKERLTQATAPHEPTSAAEEAEQEVEAAAASAARLLWEELERLALQGPMHLLYEEEGQRAWAEARLAFVLHRGLLPQLLENCPALAEHPEWFREAPALCLKQRHVSDLVDYWMKTPALQDRFVEAVLNPAWL